MYETIRAAAKLGHWLYFHTRDSRRSPAGFPDCVLARAGIMLVAECKRDDTGKVTTAQQEWIDEMNKVPGIVAYVVWQTPDRVARARTADSIDLQRFCQMLAARVPEHGDPSHDTVEAACQRKLDPYWRDRIKRAMEAREFVRSTREGRSVIFEIPQRPLN